MSGMGFRDDVRRLPVFGLGCAGGVSGLSLAARMAKAEPGSKVLLVVIELCTLAFRPDEMSKSNIIATALFGDGAAACGDLDRGRRRWGSSNMPANIPGPAPRMSWAGASTIRASAPSSRAAFPISPRRNFAPPPTCSSRATALTLRRHRQFLLPSRRRQGRYRAGTGLRDRRGPACRTSARCCEGFGNMSAPTVLFVLERELAKRATKGRRFISALGPGFTASFITMLH